MEGTGYDPRYRPWFSTAASGPKDIIIMIDASKSMDEKVGGGPDALSLIDIAKNAAKKVFNTFTEYDYATVISFNSNASSWSNELLPMTADNLSSSNLDSIWS